MKHGTLHAYNRLRCPCSACLEAHRAAKAKFRKAGLIERDGRPYNLRAPHGTAYGYSDYGCRCPSCTDANTETRRRYRAAARTARKAHAS